MGPVWDYNEAFGQCCGYPIEGYQRNGNSGPGHSGGSAISPQVSAQAPHSLQPWQFACQPCAL